MVTAKALRLLTTRYSPGLPPGVPGLHSSRAFTSAVVVSGEDGPRYPTEHELPRLVTEMDVLGVAFDNTFAVEIAAAEVREHRIGRHWVQVISSATSPYIATSVLGMAPAPVGPEGAGMLIAAPRSGMTVFMPIRERGDLEVVGPLSDVVRAIHARCEDPCNDRLYWLAGESFYPVSADPASDRVVVDPALHPIIRRLR
ncbi:hypothetical protein [Nocardia seriolae]|uniref:Uncharacterized protein n=1 Tax=Nocardia seriolae TaxID=37332 RepID=A0A0B8NRS1_9NOCA|nr:hypothetical protein [Nocardia seriolae]MTJ64957.1 hypothetical protein [Nocardia seriolae]MTJ76508.1 hypothetical protein [Nocardia seriolae]MTJ89773.1 hypothetical protein [Nocardia seriolae]MTK33748.1 hypothetical protein [Nocardia seriolae]MTK42902.1 hypothetical protein [Nocardia seriolae]